MPYGGAQVVIQLIDYDDGDATFYGDYLKMVEFLQTRLLSFKFVDRDRGKDRLELSFRNDDFAMVDSPVFAKGQKLLVTWGWPGRMVPPRRMVVQTVKGSNPVKVTAHCRLSLLDRQKRSRFEENMTDSEFVRRIAEENGYSGTFQWVEDTKVRRDITQAHVTDARMLNRLARRNGFVFYEDASGLHWHKRKFEVEPTRWYTYRQDPGVGDVLGEPQVDINMSKGIATVKVAFRDPRTKEYGEVTGGPDDTELDSLGEETEMGDPGDSNQGRRAERMTRIDVRYGGSKTREEAQTEADARYIETASKRYKMTVPVIGDHRVGAKIVVGFVGISALLDGLWYIAEAENMVAGGKFVQTLKMRKNAVNRLKTAKKAGAGTKSKKNPAVVDLGESTIEAEVPTLKKKLTLTTDTAGNVVSAFVFTDGLEDTVGQLSDLSPDQIENLNDRLLEELYQQGAQSAEPDSGS